MRLYDTHCHFERADPAEIAAVLARAKAAGVEKLMAVGGSPALNESAALAVEVAAEALVAPKVSCAIGFDREQINGLGDAETRSLSSPLCLNQKALGEIGLDYHYSPETREAQLKRVYGFILELAEKFKASGKQFVFMANIPASKANEQNGSDYWRILHMSDIHDLYVKASCVCDFPLIPMYTLFKDYCELHKLAIDDLLGDGLHPNDRGYEVMFSILMKEIGLSIDVADHVSP